MKKSCGSGNSLNSYENDTRINEKHCNFILFIYTTEQIVKWSKHATLKLYSYMEKNAFKNFNNCAKDNTMILKICNRMPLKLFMSINLTQ